LPDMSVVLTRGLGVGAWYMSESYISCPLLGSIVLPTFLRMLA
jgi:hypothetical protein